jgi:hypothetical protein
VSEHVKDVQTARAAEAATREAAAAARAAVAVAREAAAAAAAYDAWKPVAEAESVLAFVESGATLADARVAAGVWQYLEAAP